MMNSRTRSIIALLATLAISIVLIGSSLINNAQSRRELSEARGQRTELRQLLLEVRDERKSVVKELEQHKQDRQGLEDDLDALQGSKAWSRYLAAEAAYDRALIAEGRLDTTVSDLRATTRRLAVEYRDDKPWYPKGFDTYGDGIAYRWVDTSCDYYTRCSGLEVVSRDGCYGGLYVEANVMAGSTVVGYTNDLLGGVGAGDRARMKLSITEDEGSSVRLTEINCY